MALNHEQMYAYVDTLAPFMIRDVKLMYPHLHTRQSYEGVLSDKYDVNIILDPNNPKDEALYNQLLAKAGEIWTHVFDGKMQAGKCAIKDGDERNKVYHGYRTIIAKSRKLTRPYVMDGTAPDPLARVDVDECKIKDGSFADVKVRWNVVNAPKGKWIGIELMAVRYLRDGESLGGSHELSDDEYTSDFDSDPSPTNIASSEDVDDILG